MAFNDVIYYRHEFCILSLVNKIRLIDPLHLFICWDRDYAQFVDLIELGGLRHCRSSHAGELLVKSEIVLKRNRG